MRLSRVGTVGVRRRRRLCALGVPTLSPSATEARVPARAAARAELAARGGADDLRAHERKVPKGGDGEESEAHRRHLVIEDERKEQQTQQMRTSA